MYEHVTGCAQTCLRCGGRWYMWYNLQKRKEVWDGGAVLIAGLGCINGGGEYHVDIYEQS
jgi:hypothetical protein